MDWLTPRHKRKNTIRLLAMMESGQLVDEVADIVQTQVIAHKARASIRNRDAVPIYYHTEENRPPVWQENALIETGLSQPPGMDSRYVLEDSLNLWKGIKTGAVEVDGESKIRANSLQIASITASVFVFFACAWFAGLNAGGDAVAVAAAAVAVAEAVEEVPEAAVEEEFSHGFVEGPAGEESEAETGAEGTTGGREGGGDGTQDPVEPRAPVGAGQGDAPRVQR